MMEAVRTSETSVDNHFTRQYNPEDSSEQKNIVIQQRSWMSLDVPKKQENARLFAKR
jgi:hypothetical protein